MKITIRQRILARLVALHGRRYGSELANLLAGIALCFRLLPPCGPATPTKAWHIPVAFIGLIGFLLLLAPVLNMLRGGIHTVGSLPASVTLPVIGMLISLLLRRKGKKYLQPLIPGLTGQA